MQAFIPAAGLGTRLKPLTENRPKALVEVNGVPLIKIAIDNLAQQGATRIVVNVHHFADLLCNYLTQQHWDVEVLVSDERNQLLDTGGGIKKAASLFSPSEPIVIHNVDILSYINIMELVTQHTNSMNLATLAISRRETSRQLLFTPLGQLTGWVNHSSGETLWVNSPTDTYDELAFSGIAVVQPQLLDMLPPADHPYPIIPCYLSIAKNHRINAFVHDSSDWIDVGKPETLKQAQQWKLF